MGGIYSNGSCEDLYEYGCGCVDFGLQLRTVMKSYGDYENSRRSQNEALLDSNKSRQ